MNKLEWRRWWNISWPRWSKIVEIHKFILGNVEKSQHKQKKDISIKKRKKNVDQFCCMVKMSKPNKK